MTFRNVTKITLLLLALTCCSPLAVAASTTTPEKLMYVCPKISELVKSSENHWGTKDGNFRNFDVSLANKLKGFIGAQWQGANLGYVTCVYQPENPNLFFVTVLFNKLTYEPSSQHTAWMKSPKGPWYNCKSKDPKDCPFLIQPTPKKTDVYQEAEKLKQESDPYDDNPAF